MFVQAGGGAWHHRRGRSVRDEHQHCSCNGINVCTKCHEWIHAHPFESREKGWIVSRENPNPGTQLMQNQMYGRIRLDCEGHYKSYPDEY